PMAGKLIIYGATGYTGQLVSEQAKRAGRDAEKIRAAGRLHGMISNDAILSPSSLKKNRRSTGLPGKFPTRWLVTTVFPSFSSHAKWLARVFILCRDVHLPLFDCGPAFVGVALVLHDGIRSETL